MTDEQIEVTVVVVVNPRRARTPVIGRTTGTRRGGDVRELSAAAIVEEPVATNSSDEHIGQPVVVVVAHRYAHSVKADVQPRTCGDILEPARAVVSAKRHRGRVLAVGRRLPGPES